MSDKAVGSNGVALVRDFVESRLGSDSNQNATVLSAINSLDEKPLNGSGLAVLRDWINAKIAAIPGLDENTADATAYASDISEGKTAYARGVKLVGTLPDVVGVNLYQSGSIITGPGDIPNGSGDYDVVNRTIIGGTMVNDRILREGARVSIATRSSLFGDADPSDVLQGKTFTAKDGKETGTIPVRSASSLSSIGASVNVPAGYYPEEVNQTVAITTQATPSISIDENGLITANSIQIGSGYVSSGVKSATKQLSTQAAITITPGTSEKTAVSKLKFTTGDVKVAGDADLIPSNIKSGVDIFGVTGTLSVGTITSDATAAASDIASGKTAYVNGTKVTGNVPVTNGNSTKTYTNPELLIMESGSDTYAVLKVATTEDRLIRTGAEIKMYASPSAFGDAEASDVASGKTFTSSAGVLRSGTLPVTNSGSALAVSNTTVTYFTSGKIRLSGTYATDRIIRGGATVNAFAEASNFGDATVSDVASGKTFTSSAGVNKSGTLSTVGSTGTFSVTADQVYLSSGSQPNQYLNFRTTLTLDKLIRAGGKINILTALSNLGDAETSDVASGKTFTSSAGGIVTGTVQVVPSGNDSGSIYQSTSISESNDTEGKLFYCKAPIPNPILFRSNSNVRVLTRANEYGDAAVDNVLSGKTFTSTAGLKKVGTWKPNNINLLDNWYFANAVNQRAQSSYTNEGYAIDRWNMRWNGDGVITLHNQGAYDGYISLYRSAYSSHLYQNIDVTEYRNRTLTFSVLARVESGGIACIYCHYFNSDNNIILIDDSHYTTSTSWDLVSCTFTVPYNATYMSVGFTSANSVKSYFRAAKLEFGNTSTLAFKNASSIWSLNDPIPNKAVELAKCQRYYKRMSSRSFALYNFGNDGKITFSLPLQNTMRATPFVNLLANSFSCTAYKTGYGTTTTISVSNASVTSSDINDTYASIKVSGDYSGTYSSNTALLVYPSSDFNMFEFDAEIPPYFVTS